MANANLQGDAAYAGFWRRYAALSVDSVLLIVVMLLAIAADIDVMGSMVNIVLSLAGLIYYVAMESSPMQATVGKMLVGIYVTDTDGDRISMLRSLGRTAAKIVSAIPLYIGFLIAAFTGRKQGLHDMIAGCLVLRREGAGAGRAWGAVFASGVLLIGAAVMFGSQFQKAFKEQMDTAMNDGVKAPAPTPAKPPAAKPPPAPAPQPVAAAPAVPNPVAATVAAPKPASPAAPVAPSGTAVPAKPAVTASPVPAKMAAAEPVKQSAAAPVVESKPSAPAKLAIAEKPAAPSRKRPPDSALRDCLNLESNQAIAKCAEPWR